MPKPLKILGYAIAGAFGLVLTAYMAIWLILGWHTWPKSWDTSDSDFLSVAMPPLEVCGSIPAAFRVTHYFCHNNFNDGDELWRLESRDASAVSDLLKKLNLIPANPKDHIQYFLSFIEDKPGWVVRPQTDKPWLFIEADQQTSDGSRGCMFGRLYLWSTDGKVFFLYHIIT
ncbi:MAG: hypothetical protein ABTR07_13585 [Candidatus Competibacter denitrificans]